MNVYVTHPLQAGDGVEGVESRMKISVEDFKKAIDNLEFGWFETYNSYNYRVYLKDIIEAINTAKWNSLPDNMKTWTVWRWLSLDRREPNDV